MPLPIAFRSISLLRRYLPAAAYLDRQAARSPITYDAGFPVFRDSGVPVHDAALMDRARRPAAEMSCSAGEAM